MNPISEKLVEQIKEQAASIVASKNLGAVNITALKLGLQGVDIKAPTPEKLKDTGLLKYIKELLQDKKYSSVVASGIVSHSLETVMLVVMYYVDFSFIEGITKKGDLKEAPKELVEAIAPTYFGTLSIVVHTYNGISRTATIDFKRIRDENNDDGIAVNANSYGNYSALLLAIAPVFGAITQSATPVLDRARVRDLELSEDCLYAVRKHRSEEPAVVILARYDADDVVWRTVTGQSYDISPDDVISVVDY